VTTPFRWDLSRRESLGHLVSGERPWSYREFQSDLLDCIPRVITQAQQSELVFIGRSPESIFDLMSGLLAETAWAPRLSLLNLSLRSLNAEELRTLPVQRRALRALLQDAGFSPMHLVRSKRPVAFIDLVYTGRTFSTLAGSLLDWGREARIDADEMARRIRWIGVTEQGPTSPKTWRWQQHWNYTQAFPPRVIRNVSIPSRLWTYLGDYQPKVTVSSPPDSWRDPGLRTPPRDANQLSALRLAWDLYMLGTARTTRLALARRLARSDRMDARWLRALVLELKMKR